MDQGLTIMCHLYVRTVNKPSEHAQVLCVSRDVNNSEQIKEKTRKFQIVYVGYTNLDIANLNIA